MQDARIACLTGFMGSGKSTIGRILAAQLAWHFSDLDTEIERHTNLQVSQIFEQRGETVFRDIEHECLRRVLGRALEQNARMVLALGGGTLAQPRNAELVGELKVARPGSLSVIWLDCPLEDLLKRCALMDNRPLFRDEASFRKLYQERLPYYRQADWQVETREEPLRVVARILALGIFEGSARVPDATPSGASSA